MKLNFTSSMAAWDLAVPSEFDVALRIRLRR
jgi:hypothetical protein